MALVEEARIQLETEVTSYIRAAQQPFDPVLPSTDDSLLSLGMAPAKKTTSKTIKVNGKRVAATTSTATAAINSPAHRRPGAQKQARAKLLEMTKKLQRAIFIAAQMSKDEVSAIDGNGDAAGFLSRRGSRAEGSVSRQPSTLSFTTANKSTTANTLALPGTETSSTSSSSSNKKSASSAAGATVAAAAAGERRADARLASPHAASQPQFLSSASLPDTQLSYSFARRHRDTTRSYSTVTSAMGRERSGPPNSVAGGATSSVNSAAALHRLEASLMFTNDCIRYASTFADAGLTQEAQTCFLQLIAQDIASCYEPIVARCVERHPHTTIRQQQQQLQKQQRKATAPVTAAEAARRRRTSKGRSAKEGQKTNPLSPNSAELSTQCATSSKASSMKDVQDATGAINDRDVDGAAGSICVTDNTDVFASDVRLPLALQVYKCVLRYRALVTYIRFHETLQADPHGDAAGMATSASACTALEELVTQQQKVLHTVPFSAAAVIRSEEAGIKEDVARAAAANPVNAIVVAGGCKLVDLLAEPVPANPSPTTLPLTSLAADPPALLYVVEDVAAPVLFTTQLYVARMAEELLTYIRSTTTAAMAHVCSELRTAVIQRCLEAVRASVSISELHLAGPADTASSKGQQQQQKTLYNKTCLPLASVDYLSWRLQEYALLQYGYLQLEDSGTAPAVAAAEHALQQVLQLQELAYLDPIPPPTTTMAALDAAVQRCAAWLLVSTWRAAVTHGGTGVNPYHALSSLSPVGPTTQPPASPADPAALNQPAISPGAAANNTSNSADLSPGEPSLGGDLSATAALQMAATARTAAAAIKSAVQQAVAYLITAQWVRNDNNNGLTNTGALSNGGDGAPRPGSKRSGGGSNNASAPAASNTAAAASAMGRGSFGFAGESSGPPAMNGTRLLVILWVCVAQVQQQCMLLAGRTAIADALAAAAKETDYVDATANGLEWSDSVRGLDGRSHGLDEATTPTRASTPQKQPSPERSPAQGKGNSRNANKPKTAATANASPMSSTPRDGAKQVGGSNAATAAVPSSNVPVELRHAHPAVAYLAARFPCMALELILHLVGVVEVLGGVPQAPPYRGQSEGSKKRSPRCGDVSAGHDSVAASSGGRKLNETPERRTARGGRRRASSVAISSDSLNSSLTAPVSAGANYAMTAVAAMRQRALQSVYRGCVEALEVLLHAAAVKSTTPAAPPHSSTDQTALPFNTSLASTTLTRTAVAPGENRATGLQALSPLSVLAHATAWNDAVEVLGYCDVTETEGDVVASRNPAPQQDRPTAPSLQRPRYYSPATLPPAYPMTVCFLYDPADTRCVLRWVSWETLFQGIESGAVTAERKSGPPFTLKCLAEASIVRAVTALRTLTFASPRLAVAVRVGLAMELWWRAQLASTAKKTNTTTATAVKPPTATAAPTAVALKTASPTAVECALRCVQLLRAVVLAAMLQQQQHSSPHQQEQNALKKESPLTAVLHLFEDTACALDVLVPATPETCTPSLPFNAAASATAAVETLLTPPLASPPAGEVCQSEEQPTSTSAQPKVHTAVSVSVAAAEAEYTHLAAQAQAALQLSMFQRRSSCSVNGHRSVALREYDETDGLCDAPAYRGEATALSSPHSFPPSIWLYKVAAVLVEKATAALCPAVDENEGCSSSNSNSRNSKLSPPSPPCAVLLLQPITTDAGNLFLRCAEALRAQWQRQRTRRLLLQVGNVNSASAATFAATPDEATGAATGTAAAQVSCDPSWQQEEQEAREESHYATTMWCVLSFLWHSSNGSTSSGAPPLEESGVAAIVRRVSTGFLQLLPNEGIGNGAATAPAARLTPLQLSRLLVHGATVLRLLELTRNHLQDHVESLLRHTANSVTHGRGYSHLHHPHKSVASTLNFTASSSSPSSPVPTTAAQQLSQRRTLVAARDGLTELTHRWVTVRWHLARLRAHHNDYTARHTDIEILQQRHDQQQIYGRPTAKELRILRTLEQDAPLLPTTAKDEEVRLKRWVTDQQHTAAGTALATSALLLEALVCAALVPLNTADPSGQQKLIDEAVRALADAEKNSGSGTGEASHLLGSSGINRSAAATTTQQQQQQPTHRYTQDSFVIYTPVLLWCYLAEACSRCGTAEQTALVLGVLDKHLLMESAEVSRPANAADTAVATTAPFLQRLLLQPRWAVLEDCSMITRVAFCRALNALASRSNTAPSLSSAGPALVSLQSAYRLLLALQIQQLPDPSPATTTAGATATASSYAATRSTQQQSSDKKKNETAVFTSGTSDSAQRHAVTSKLTLSFAQQLMSAITEYLTRSADIATSHGGSPGAALLLPLLVELCSVLLRLPALSPQWADGEVQLFALRVLTIFKQQQLAVLQASPSPLTTATGATTITSVTTTAGAAAATAALMMDAFLQLLWVTFAHVWNSVFCNPNARQRRCIAAHASNTQWARRVFEQHRKHAQQMSVPGRECNADTLENDNGDAGGFDSSATNRHARSPRKGGNNSNGANPTNSDGVQSADANVFAMSAADAQVNPLSFAGAAYLPERDDGAHHDEERPFAGAAASNASPSAAAAGESELAERHRAPGPRPKTGGNNNGNSNNSTRGVVASLPTVFLHARMPCEYMELLEDILFHLPSLWSYLLAPPGTILIPAVSAALNRAANDAAQTTSTIKDTAHSTSSPPHTSENDNTAHMQTQYDFVCYAALQATQALRESQRLNNAAGGTATANTSASNERRASATAAAAAVVSTGGLLYGLSPIYMDVVAALQQYEMTATNSNSTSNSSSNPQQGGGGSAHIGGNGRNVNGSTVAPAVSAPCLALLEVLNKYKEDPNYAKLAVHVVREMLAFRNDDYSIAALGGAFNSGATSGAITAGTSGNTANVNGNNSRRKNPAGSADGAGSAGMSGKGSSTGASATVVTTDVRHVIRTVRDEVLENQRLIRAFLSTVEVETEAWLTYGGYRLVGQVQQQQRQHVQGNKGNGVGAPSSLAGAAAAATARGDSGNGGNTTKSGGLVAAAGKKAGKKGPNKKTAGGKAGKAEANGRDDDADEENALHNGEVNSPNGVTYTKVTRVFSFTEEQKLRQLTCGVARWRRSRAGRLLRQRYVQYNTPFLAQLHLIEAALLHMAATAQREAAKQKTVLQELLTLTDGTADAPTNATAAALKRNGGSANGAGGASPGTSPRTTSRDKKKAGSSCGTSPSTGTRDSADPDEGPALLTEELLHHCVRASNLFQYLWLPPRAFAAVQLAVSHLQHASLPTVPCSPSNTAAAGASPPKGTLTVAATLVSQLLAVPLFSIAAVQQGFYDARRDVHHCVLQPTAMTVGSAVAWANREDFVTSVPSLFTLTSSVGQRGEQEMARRAGLRARQQRRYELLQLSWCVEAESETRAEAVRDELQDRVRILQQVQQILPLSPSQNTSLKARLASAAELLALASQKKIRTTTLMRSMKPKRVNTAEQERQPASAQSRDTVHTAAVTAADALPYSPFEGLRTGWDETRDSKGGHGSSTRPPLQGASTIMANNSEGSSSITCVDAACYGRDMPEAHLVSQLISLAQVLEYDDPKKCAAAYRIAQQLTHGRYATELLPCLLRVEEIVSGREAAGTTLQAYEEALHRLPDGVWLLETARSARRQWSTATLSSSYPRQTKLLNHSGTAGRSGTFAAGMAATASWKAVVEAYQCAARALRSAGFLQLLGECLYELGSLLCAAGRRREAERNWKDALDCFLSTPHVFEDWHAQRTVPPPPPPLSSSSASASLAGQRRGVEELVWMTAALTSLAEHAYASDAARATDAQLLCALLVHQYWGLPSVVDDSAGGIKANVATAKSSSSWRRGAGALPCAEYSQLDITSLSVTSSSSSTTSRSDRKPPTAMPDTLPHVVRALTDASHLLVQLHFSSEASVLGAFSDFMATMHLQQVELAVRARLTRAIAAADLGSFAVAMRHVHSVCVGSNLPQPQRGVVSPDNLPSYYSIASAAAAAAATARSTGGQQHLPTALASAKKMPGGGSASPGSSAGAGGNGGGGGGGSSSIATAAATPANSGAVSLSTAVTILPASVAALFYFYRDHESPSSLHNTAAIRCFVMACLPGLAVDTALSVSSSSSPTVRAPVGVATTTTATLPLVGGLLASSALEEQYGLCLLRMICLTVAEVLVRIGTCDPAYLFRSPSLLPWPSSEMEAGSGTRTGNSNAAAVEAVSLAQFPFTSLSGGSPPSLFPMSSAAFSPLATGERPTNACTEACRYARVLLQSLRSIDIRLALVGQPSISAWTAGSASGEEAESVSAGRATRPSVETSGRTRTNTTSDAVSDLAQHNITVASVLRRGQASEGVEHYSAEQSVESALWLDTLGAIRQWAVLLTGETLAAQGQYSACLQLLTSAIAEYNEGKGGQVFLFSATAAAPVGGEGCDVSGHLTQSTRPPPAAIESLYGYGMQGDHGNSSSNSTATLPFNFTYVHWIRVWLLMCRCYCLLRQYTHLEHAAGTQGLQLCDAFGVTHMQRSAFQLYRLYALVQMGRLKEVAEAAADLQNATAATLTGSDNATSSQNDTYTTEGIIDNGSVAVALQWWQAEHGRFAGEAPLAAAPDARSVVKQLQRVATTERGILPWRPLPSSTQAPAATAVTTTGVLLALPNAHAVVPLCTLSGYAKTRDVWQLHHVINRYALTMQSPTGRFAQLVSASTAEKTKEEGSTLTAGAAAARSLRRSPQPLPSSKKTVINSGSSARNTASPATPRNTSPFNPAAPNHSGAATTTAALQLLREAQEAVATQYTAQAHPRHWMESRLLMTRMKAKALCDMLNAHQQRRQQEQDNGKRSDSDEDSVTQTVEFALVHDPDAPKPSVAAATAIPTLVITSRAAALAALPVPIRDVCEDLLSALQQLVQLPVQRHALLCGILLDLAAVLSTYIRDVRTRQRTKVTQRPAAAAVNPVSLLSQFEAVVAACILLAGLVSDMERRVRTGADSFRGYFTDPRLASPEVCEATANLLQSQWPESLRTAVQQTHNSVGQLQVAPSQKTSRNGTLSAATEVISHPFYTLPAVQQQLFGITTNTGSGTAGATTATGGAANATSGGSGSGGSAGSRDQNAGSSITTSGNKRNAAPAQAHVIPGTSASAPLPTSSISPLLSVPTLALTFATLSDEAAAVQALTPVPVALEHDVAIQLLTSHLQRLSPPINCTYLCYRDDTRQQLLTAVAAVLTQQQSLQQQQQRGGGQRRTSGLTAQKRSGGATGSGGGQPRSPTAAGVGATLNFTEADIWKALVPPVLLSAVPAELFSAAGPDTLGAPLYNSVAAAALSTPDSQPSSTPPAKKAGSASWQLFLAVSPLHDVNVAEAPVLTPSNTTTAAATAVAASTEAMMQLLPPAYLVTAANEGLSSVNSGLEGGGGNANLPHPLGGSSSRGRGPARPSGVGSTATTVVAPMRRSSGQDATLVYGATTTTNGNCLWPPLLTSSTANSPFCPASCLVPSTNWAFLDQIQHEGLSSSQPPLDDNNTGLTVAAAVKPTPPAIGNRGHVLSKPPRGANASTATSATSTTASGAAQPSATSLTAGHSDRAKAPTHSVESADAAAAAHAPLRWSSVSLELSDGTMQTLRRHLCAVLRCQYRVKADEATTDTADPARTLHEIAGSAAAPAPAPPLQTKTASSALEASVKSESDGAARAENATRSALAAAVSRAQQSLRSHLAAAGAAVGALGGSNGSSMNPGIVTMGAGGVPSSSHGAAATANGGAPSSVAATAAGTAGSGSGMPASCAVTATGNLASTSRKSSPRVGSLNTNTAAHHSSGGNGDAVGPTTTTAAFTGVSCSNESSATHDDLTEVVRARQTAERERRREQLAEELEEANASLLRELLEAVVSAAIAGSGVVGAVMDEARVELDVQRLLPRCTLSPTIVKFLCDWLGGVSPATVDGVNVEDMSATASMSYSSGHTSLCFYNPGLHEWMQQVVQYVAEQQQQQHTSQCNRLF